MNNTPHTSFYLSSKASELLSGRHQDYGGRYFRTGMSSLTKHSKTASNNSSLWKRYSDVIDNVRHLKEYLKPGTYNLNSDSDSFLSTHDAYLFSQNKNSSDSKVHTMLDYVNQQSENFLRADRITTIPQHIYFPDSKSQRILGYETGLYL